MDQAFGSTGRADGGSAQAAAPGDAPRQAPQPLRVPGLAFDNRFARLPDGFYARVRPAPLPEPWLVAASTDAAEALGLPASAFDDPAVVDALAGNRPIDGAEPLAAVYAGHQFGVWAGRLGDGRAILLGEAIGAEGSRWELQLKGAGRTPFSRGADGRAVLRSSIREFLCSEAMHGLGIPTTRALALVASDEPVFRETVETAAVVTRMSPSFLRFGSFEYFRHFGQPERLKLLGETLLAQHYPELLGAPNPWLALLREVTERTARLVAAWQSVGFCHGVMNTDNMSALGLTIDYGPFGFLDRFDPNHVCNHSDDLGRYSYSMQPKIAEWNCWCLGDALMPLIAEAGGGVDDAKEALASFGPAFDAEYGRLMRAKLGLATERGGDDALVRATLDLLHAQRVDFTSFFRRLGSVGLAAEDIRPGAQRPGSRCRDLFVDPALFDGWAARWRARLRDEGSNDAERGRRMNRVNPKYVLRNHLAELAIRQARERDPGMVRRLLQVLRRPFDDQPEHEDLAALPPDWAAHLEVSCSS
ncbi:YdiU family protein [Burkholderiaceae bacterium FT117]|uniref:protein adenylyltransferase SelO n=1 Tax=Zeimonas sediminis TaxID=2944268 RepID=UPI002343138B|nr:YdiU family protein [Zeimonas sediminis]MCM5569226.1 YdiU family protein [Zeimonas sediminis]